MGVNAAGVREMWRLKNILNCRGGKTLDREREREVLYIRSDPQSRASNLELSFFQLNVEILFTF